MNAQTVECEFGEVYQGEAVDCLIEFSNPTDAPMRISAIKPVSEGDRVDQASFDLPARGTHQLKLHLDTSVQAGLVRHYVKFTTNDNPQPGAAQAAGFIATIADDAKPLLDLGVVNLSEAKRVPAVIRFESREASAFRIAKVLKAPGYLDLKIGEDGRSVEAGVKNDADWGVHDDHVQLAIENASRQKVLSFQVKANVLGDVVPSSNPFAMDVMRKGNRNEFLIRMEQKDGGSLKLGALTLKNLAGSVQAVPCVPSKKNCRNLKLTISDEQPTGAVLGRLMVELPSFKRTLPIELWGLFLKPETKVRDLDEEFAQAAKNASTAEPVSGQSSAVGGSKFTDLVKKAVKTSSAGDPPGKGPLLRWEVANEGSIYGYFILRGDAKDGAYSRINAETIKTMSEGDGGASYVWRDQTAESGRTYWYYIGLIEKGGSKKALSEPTMVVAK